MFFEVVFKLEVKTFLFGVVFIYYFLSLLFPVGGGRSDIGFHSQAVEAESFGEFVDAEFVFGWFTRTNLVNATST